MHSNGICACHPCCNCHEMTWTGGMGATIFVSQSSSMNWAFSCSFQRSHLSPSECCLTLTVAFASTGFRIAWYPSGLWGCPAPLFPPNIKPLADCLSSTNHLKKFGFTWNFTWWKTCELYHLIYSSQKPMQIFCKRLIDSWQSMVTSNPGSPVKPVVCSSDPSCNVQRKVWTEIGCLKHSRKGRLDISGILVVLKSQSFIHLIMKMLDNPG